MKFAMTEILIRMMDVRLFAQSRLVLHVNKSRVFAVLIVGTGRSLD